MHPKHCENVTIKREYKILLTHMVTFSLKTPKFCSKHTCNIIYTSKNEMNTIFTKTKYNQTSKRQKQISVH